jgi:uncharacterized protein YndB with AHSA1/START domain
MNKDLKVQKDIFIKADAAKVWKGLTDPEQIKKYLFGTETVTDWKKGSSITFRGVWKGKTYEDKGQILEADPGKRLQYTYWSSMSGMEDLPENYAIVTFELKPEKDGILLTLTNSNHADEKSRDHAGENWVMVLQQVKELLEK